MAQLHVTVAPVATLRLAGEKKLLPTVTSFPPPPPLGPVVVSEPPPPPQAAKLAIASARSTAFHCMVHLRSTVTSYCMESFTSNAAGAAGLASLQRTCGSRSPAAI